MIRERNHLWYTFIAFGRRYKKRIRGGSEKKRYREWREGERERERGWERERERERVWEREREREGERVRKRERVREREKKRKRGDRDRMHLAVKRIRGGSEKKRYREWREIALGLPLLGEASGYKCQSIQISNCGCHLNL
jgi:hypothetical protein